MAGKSSTKREREARASRIRAADARGDRAELIARREGVSSRQVRRVLAASDPAPLAVTDAPDVFALDPFGELAACVGAHREAIAMLRSVASRSRNESVKVGASKSAAATSASLLDLLTRVGVMPQETFQWRSEDAWRQAWGLLGEALVDSGVDPLVFAEGLNRRIGRQGGTEVALLDLGPEFEVAAA